jgi:hypothetical protein
MKTQPLKPIPLGKIKTVKTLFKDKSRWTKDAMALDPDGSYVGLHDGQTAQVCLLGAIEFCYRDSNKRDKVLNKVQNYLYEKYENDDIADWNDRPGRNFKHVKDLVTKLNI